MMVSSFAYLHRLTVSHSSFLTIRKVTLDSSVDFVWPQLRLTDYGHKDIGEFLHTLFRKAWIFLLDIIPMKHFHSVDCFLTVCFTGRTIFSQVFLFCLWTNIFGETWQEVLKQWLVKMGGTSYFTECSFFLLFESSMMLFENSYYANSLSILSVNHCHKEQ